MFRTCLLTDSTATFTKPAYPGHEHVHIITHDPETSLAPSIDSFRKTFVSLGNQYQEIIALLGSSHLSPAVNNARQAAEALRSPLNIQVIDSQSTSVGLGLLAQAGADAIRRGLSLTDISNHLRGLLRNVYAIFCLPDLMTLYRSGQIDKEQAIVGEMLGVIPIFIMENGQLMHVLKARSSRNIVDAFYEFVMEFEHLKYIALLQGSSYFEQECRTLSERINQNLRTPHMLEYTINPWVASLLGPRSIGIISMQKSHNDRT